jgi:hypothetical protein
MQFIYTFDCVQHVLHRTVDFFGHCPSKSCTPDNVQPVQRLHAVYTVLRYRYTSLFYMKCFVEQVGADIEHQILFRGG